MRTANMTEGQQRAFELYLRRIQQAQQQNSWELRDHLLRSVARYIATGVPPQSDFLQSILEDSLSKSIGHADRDSMKNLESWARLLYTYVPAAAWGSREAIESWEGIEFIMEEEEEEV